MLASTILLYVTAEPPLPTSIFIQLSPLSVHLQYLSVRVTCQFSNEGVDINPWRPGDQGSEWWPKLFKYNKSPLSTLKKMIKIKSKKNGMKWFKYNNIRYYLKKKNKTKKNQHKNQKTV